MLDALPIPKVTSESYAYVVLNCPNALLVPANWEGNARFAQDVYQDRTLPIGLTDCLKRLSEGEYLHKLQDVGNGFTVLKIVFPCKIDLSLDEQAVILDGVLIQTGIVIDKCFIGWSAYNQTKAFLSIEWDGTIY